MSKDNTYRVIIQYGDDSGCIEYDMSSKTIQVELPNEEKRREVEEYLQQRHAIQVEQNTLVDFTAREVAPSENLENLKLALTRLWGATGVLVAWSRPA